MEKCGDFEWWNGISEDQRGLAQIVTKDLWPWGEIIGPADQKETLSSSGRAPPRRLISAFSPP
jgi:hypothetical protein